MPDIAIVQTYPKTAEQADLEDVRNVSRIFFAPGPAPTLDEDGGQLLLYVGISDPAAGDVASASIDISAATVTLAKSTAGGAPSTTGITQPTVAKENGLVKIEGDILAAEWTAGDAYKVVLKGVKATDGNGKVVNLPPFAWAGHVGEQADVRTQLGVLHDTRIPGVVQPQTGDSFARLGAPAGASIAADVAAIKAETAKAWKREAVTAFSNAALGTTETTILDKGADAGPDAYRLEGAVCNVAALGTGTTTVNFRVKAEINGVLTVIATVARTATGAFNLANLAGAPIATRHLVVTVQRNEGTGTDGSVSASVETSKST